MNYKKIFSIILYALTLAVLLWALLKWGTPWAVKQLPGVCDKWDLKGGVCSESTIRKIEELNNWSEDNLGFIFVEKREEGILDKAYAGLDVIESAARKKAGDEKVDGALNNVSASLERAGKVLGAETTSRKVKEIPVNAMDILNRAKTALRELSKTLDSSSKKANEITEAVEKTRGALDAVSSALPEESK